MSGVRVSHLGPESEKNRQKWRFFCVYSSLVRAVDPLWLFNVGQLNSNGAGISPALFFTLTHILTHNTAIYNGQDSTIANKACEFNPTMMCFSI